MNTLALNAGAIPVSVIPIRSAITAILNERAIALANYDGVMRSSGVASFSFSFLKKSKNESYTIPIPSVIQYIHSNHIPKSYTKVLPFSRKNVYIRDRGRCMYCGKKVSINSFTFDHVIPQCIGGESCWENVVVCCLRCNSQKGNRPLKRYKRSLIQEPYAPRLDKAAPTHIVSKIAAEIPHETWTDYIYWNIILMP